MVSQNKKVIKLFFISIEIDYSIEYAKLLLFHLVVLLSFENEFG